MIKTRALKLKDIELIDKQDGDSMPESRLINAAISKGDAFTIEKDGKILAVIAGYSAWAGVIGVASLISKTSGKDFMGLVRAFKKLIEARTEERIEFIVKTNFKQGHRLARILGFVREGTMRKYRDGIDYDLYSRVMDDFKTTNRL